MLEFEIELELLLLRRGMTGRVEWSTEFILEIKKTVGGRTIHLTSRIRSIGEKSIGGSSWALVRRVLVRGAGRAGAAAHRVTRFYVQTTLIVGQPTCQNFTDVGTLLTNSAARAAEAGVDLESKIFCQAVTHVAGLMIKFTGAVPRVRTSMWQAHGGSQLYINAGNAGAGIVRGQP